LSAFWQQWEQRLGLPGILAVGVLVFCAAMHFSAGRSLHREVIGLEAAQAAQHSAPRGQARHGPQDLAAVLRELPKEAELAMQLARLHQMADKQGVALRRGNFEFSAESHGRIGRQQMTFQAQAPYSAMRRFVREALAAMPALALEDVAIVRAQGEADSIEANLRFSILLRRGGEG
jgi:Tfp pilus assembly protein PilO